MERYVVIHYHEVGLKGRNRPMFERRLLQNVQDRLAGLEIEEARRLSGRLLLKLAPRTSWKEVRERLQTVFGIAYFAQAYKTPLDMEALKAAVVSMLPPPAKYETFAVDTKRANKRFPLTSYQVNAEVGAAVQAHTGKAVNLSNPDLTIYIEILFKEALFYFERVPGPGGLPVGVSGRVACLLSGGIDSPVAAWYMLKRGCEAFGVHFSGHPFVTRTSQAKCVELMRVLARYGASPYLYSVPFGPIQYEIMQRVPTKLLVILYRRFMARIAEEIARQEGATALVTGESLAQVASQTLQNLATIEAAVEMPILRPLIGMDKVEIIERAKAIDTYDISIMPGEDCCQLFVPQHPATTSTVEEVEAAEAALDVAALVAQGVEQAERIDVRKATAEEMLLQF
jgi:thiamine biosynthesis protein ThiI